MPTPTATDDARVERGAVLLDERLPGWTVDLDTFCFSSPYRCIAGQIGKILPEDGRPTYVRLVRFLGLGLRDQIEYGFDIDFDQIRHNDEDLSHRALNLRMQEAWTRWLKAHPEHIKTPETL